MPPPCLLILLPPHPPVSLPPPFPLKEVKVPIVENSVCDRKYHTGVSTGDNIRIVQADMLCAGNRRHDSCQVGPRVPPQPQPTLAS